MFFKPQPDYYKLFMHLQEHKQYWRSRQSLQISNQFIHDCIMERLQSEAILIDNKWQSHHKQLSHSQHKGRSEPLAYFSERQLKLGKLIFPLPKVIKLGQISKTPPILHSRSLKQLSQEIQQDENLPKIFSIQTIKLDEDDPKLPENIIKISPFKSIPKYKKSQLDQQEHAKFSSKIKHNLPNQMFTHKMILQPKLQPIKIYKQAKKQHPKLIFNHSKKRDLISGWGINDQEFDCQF